MRPATPFKRLGILWRCWGIFADLLQKHILDLFKAHKAQSVGRMRNPPGYPHGEDMEPALAGAVFS